MKTYIDLQETYKGLFLSSKRFKNRLIRYWGTETIDGVEVFKKRFEVWPNTERTESKKILNMFGMWEAVYGQEFEGITSYYLWFNPNKAKDLSDIATDIFVNKINSYLVIGEAFTVNINFTDPADPSKFVGWSKQDILDYVDANYSTILDSNYVEVAGDKMSQEAIGKYTLLDDGSDFQVDVVSAQVTPIASKQYSMLNRSSIHYISGFSLELQVKQLRNVTETSPLVVGILEETNQEAQRKLRTLAESSSDSTDYDWISTDTTLSDGIWYKNQLRVETTNSHYLDRDDFTALIVDTLDTGYVKKKTKWYKKLLAIVIAVVVFWFSGGFAATTFTALAASLGVTALALTGLAMAIGDSFGIGFAQYFGKVVQIVGVVSSVAGIASFVNNIARGSLAQTIAQKGLYGAAKQFITEAFTTTTTLPASQAQVALAASSGATITSVTVTEISLSKIASVGMKVAMKLISARNEGKIKDLQAQVSGLSDQVEQSAEELKDLTDKEVHIGLEDIKWYTKPLKQDNVAFETNYLYEGTKYNIGRPSFVPIGLNLRDEKA